MLSLWFISLLSTTHWTYPARVRRSRWWIRFLAPPSLPPTPPTHAAFQSYAKARKTNVRQIKIFLISASHNCFPSPSAAEPGQVIALFHLKIDPLLASTAAPLPRATEAPVTFDWWCRDFALSPGAVGKWIRITFCSGFHHCVPPAGRWRWCP